MKADWALNISMPLFEGMVSGDLSLLPPSDFYTHNIAGFLLLALMVKIIATSFTVGSGMSGGFTGPLIILGVGSGALASRIIGFEAGSPEYFGFMACGLAATLASAANVPLAAIVITTRMFGGNGYLLPAITGAIIPFIIYKSRTIYEYTTTPWRSSNTKTCRPGAVEEVTVSFWYAEVGDAVEEGGDLLQVRTDKATFDVPSPAAGKLAEILADEEQPVKPGEVVGRIAEG